MIPDWIYFILSLGCIILILVAVIRAVNSIIIYFRKKREVDNSLSRIPDSFLDVVNRLDNYNKTLGGSSNEKH